MEKIRFYPNIYPNIGDIVAVRIIDIDSTIGIVHTELIEYGGINGNLVFAEISRKRIRSIKDHIKINQIDYLEVLHTNENGGNIDLSKKNVQSKDIELCKQKLYQAKQIDNILRKIALTHDISLQNLYQHIIWKMDNPFNIFQKIARCHLTDNYFDYFDYPNLDIVKSLTSVIKDKFYISTVEIRAQIDIRSYYAGIDSIKDAIKAGLECQDENNKITIKLISSPFYLIIITSNNEENGKSTIYKVIQSIKKLLEQHKGTLEIKLEPYVASNNEQFPIINEEFNTQSTNDSNNDSGNESNDVNNNNFKNEYNDVNNNDSENESNDVNNNDSGNNFNKFNNDFENEYYVLDNNEDKNIDNFEYKGILNSMSTI